MPGSNPSAVLWDTLILGAGMAGASLAYFLQRPETALLVEGESQPGYHSTGRSAAIFSETYGPVPIRQLTQGSRSFFSQPPDDFAETPLLGPRGALTIGGPGDESALEEGLAAAAATGSRVALLDRQETLARCAALNPDHVVGGLWLEEAQDMDVAAIHQGFLRGFRRRGGTVLNNSAPRTVQRLADGSWLLQTPNGPLRAQILVNATGAWADEVADMAGVPRQGLQPKRRTAMICRPDSPVDPSWPLVIDAHETVYFRPETPGLLLSPADATPVPAQDVQPEAEDIAVAVDRFQRISRLKVAKIERPWAGLRTFARDGVPVIGPDPEVPNFFWLAGQGGYGIQTATAIGQLAARLLAGIPQQAELTALGFDRSCVAPRFAELFPR